MHFHLHPARGLVHLSVRIHSRPWLAPDTVLAVRSSMARDGTSAGNDMDREPGTGDGKPGTRDGESDTGVKMEIRRCNYAPAIGAHREDTSPQNSI